VEKINIKGKSTLLHCLKCGELSKIKFYDSPYSIHAFEKKIPFCRVCINSFAKKYAEQFGTKDYHIVIFLLCRKLGITFSMKCYEKARLEMSTGLIVKKYIELSNQWSDKFKIDGFDYGEKLDDGEVIVDDENDDFEVTKDMVLFWGSFENKSDYIFLENEFANWQRDFACDNYSEKLLIRDICIIDLQLRYAISKDDTAAAKSLRLSRKDALTSGSLNPSAMKNAESSKQNTFGCWANDIENYMPAEFFENKKLYEDYDNIKSYTSELITRPIRNIISNTRDFNTPELDKIDGDG